MRVGIGLPSTLCGVSGADVLSWAATADDGPFASLATNDRLVYRNHEPLIALAGAAAVTRKVRLVTSVLLVPLRDPTWLAKQAATLDQLSGGRLSLGIGIGGRADDYRAAHVSITDRAKAFEAAIGQLKLAWSGQPLGSDIGPVGPAPIQPGGPPLFIGGFAPAALDRVGRYADGYLAPESDATFDRARYEIVLNSWARFNRPGRPQLIHTAHFALGPDAAAVASRYILDYYAFRGDAARERAASALTTDRMVRERIKCSQDAGADELILWPASAGIDQVHRLADVVASG